MLQTPPGIRVVAGIHQMHRPVLRLAAQHLHLSAGELDSHVALKRVVVQKIPLDKLALVSQRDVEFPESIPIVVLHNVPEDRPPADLDHRLRPDLGLFGQARAEAACQEYHIHRAAPPRTLTKALSCLAMNSLVQSSMGRMTPG